jgi:hypothetical protein
MIGKNGFSLIGDESMQSYLFIGGYQDGLNVPLADGAESIQLPVGNTCLETYIRDTLAVGAYASFTFYRYDELDAGGGSRPPC